MKNFTILLFMMCVTFLTHAQKINFEGCGSDELMKKRLLEDPIFLERHEETELKALKYLSEEQNIARRAKYTLPIVVHIIHDGGSENLSDNTIQQGIENLNDAFSNQNYYNQGIGTDVEIEFCLATRTPDNEPSTGINRIQSPLTELNYFNDDQTLKNLSRWKQTEYINIWVVREICNSNGCGVAGYAYLPTAHGQDYDGIVVEHEYFGESEPNTAVLVHEMGHYLGLYHTFEEGCLNDNCMEQGDRVCDTPPDNTTARPPCDHPSNSCFTDSNSGFSADQLDLKNNYMDYSNLECYNAFTPGQRDRMFFFVENIRHSLLSSKACISPCILPVTAIFDASDISIETGESITFTNNSTNSTNYLWKINGIPISSVVNLTQTFNQVGNFEITLVAENNLPDCFQDSTGIKVNVDCNIQSYFSASTLSTEINNPILFKNLSGNADNFTWTVNNVFASNSEDFSLSQPTPGLFTVCLDASNTFCSENKCVTVEFYEDNSNNDDCQKAEVRLFGSPVKDENALVMTVAPDGNLYIGGALDNKSFISKIKIDGTPIWVKSYDFSVLDDERISKLFIDTDGFLVGGGTGRTSTAQIADAFIFKFDVSSENLVWSTRTQSQSPAVFIYDILQLPQSGNYLAAGQTIQGGCDANFIEFNKNSGAVVNTFQNNYDVGSCETITSIKFLNGNILATGRYNYAGGGLDKMRTILSLFDLSGNEIWTKSYLVNLVRNARLYGQDIALENDKIYTISNGTLTGTGLNDSDLILTECEENGALNNAIQYDLPGINLSGNRLYSTDKYFFIEAKDATNERFTLFKLDKTGKLIYAFRINEWQMNIQRGNSIVIGGNHLYIIKGVQNTTNDFMLLKVPIEGMPDFSDCIDVEFLNINETVLSNPFEGNSSVIARPYSFNSNSNLQPVTDESFELTPFCTPDCDEDCQNGIDDDGDGLIDCDDPDCPCSQDHCEDAELPDAIIEIQNAVCKNDSILLEIILCNIGSSILPTQMPIQLYLKDPLVESSSPIFSMMTSVVVDTSDCITLSATISNVQNGKLFILANADHTPPPPYNLDIDFPITPIDECNYVNNFDVYELDFIRNFNIDLGGDVEICPNQTYIIAANANYSNYRWQDGSTDSTYTVFEEGVYWCCIKDDCGNSACDTIQVTYDNNMKVDLGDDLEICEGDSIQITVNTSNNHKILWYPQAEVNCDTCMSNFVKPKLQTTYIVVGQSDDGCIAVDSMIIDINPSYKSSDTIPFCTGDTITIEGIEITSAGSLEIKNQTVNGCDSIIQYEFIEAKDTFLEQSFLSICRGDTVFVFGVPVFENGIFSQTDNSGSCTIIETIEVLISNQPEGIDTLTTCSGKRVPVFDFETDIPGTYTESYSQNTLCDSIHSITLIAKDTFYNFDQFEICAGEKVDIFGITTDRAGVFTQTYSAQNGCDSTSAIEVIVRDTFATKDTFSICKNDSTLIFGNFETDSGVYFESFSSQNGCDSSHSIMLITKDTFYNFDRFEICAGEKINVFGVMTDTSGIFTQNYSIQNGCDSVSVIELIVRDTFASKDTFSICKNDSTLIFGNFETDSGIYSEGFSNQNGCDSIHSVLLITKDTFYNFDRFEICAGEKINVLGVSIDTAGIFAQNYLALNGCDSVSVIELIVRDTFASKDTFSICENDSISIFGISETEPGVYSKAFSSQNGCDSTHYIFLEKTPLFILDHQSTPTCFNDSSGTGTILINGGSPPFDYFWNTGETDSIRENLNTGIYYLTVTDQFGCEKTDSILIENEQFEITRNLNSPFCFGESTGSIELFSTNPNLEFSLNGESFTSNSLFENLPAGDYNLAIRNSSGCLLETQVEISSPSPFFVQLPNDTLINLGDSILLAPDFNQPPQNYLWSPVDFLDCVDCSSIYAGPLHSTVFHLISTNEHGCLATDSIQIRVKSTPNYFVPNAFSPNDDGINDSFTIYGDLTMVNIRELLIFDRWGNLIWEGNDLIPGDPNQGWNGKFRGDELDPSVFVFYAVVEFINGTEEILKGDISLIR